MLAPAIRSDFPASRFPIRIEDGEFTMRQYRDFLEGNTEDIARFKTTQQAAFESERERWRVLGQAEFVDETHAANSVADESDMPEGASAICSQVPGSVWKVTVKEGEVVEEGDTLVVIESMKMEFAVTAPFAGQVLKLRCAEGAAVGAGQEVVVLAATVAEVCA